MQAEQYLSKALHAGKCVVENLHKDQMGSPTPCSEWDVKALLNHMINEIRWVKPLLEGKTIAEVGTRLDGDLVGDNPLASWDNASSEATEALKILENKKQLVHLSYGDKPANEYIHELSADIVIHSWDLAKGLMTTLLLPDDIATETFKYYQSRAEWLGDGKYFQKPLEKNPNDSVFNKLLRLVGRDPTWKV